MFLSSVLCFDSKIIRFNKQGTQVGVIFIGTRNKPGLLEYYDIIIEKQ